MRLGVNEVLREWDGEEQTGKKKLWPKGYSGVGGAKEIEENREITNMKYV